MKVVVSVSAVAASIVVMSLAGRALAQRRDNIDANQAPVQRVVSPDGKLALTAEGNTLKVWDIATGRLTRTLHIPSDIASFSFTADGSHIVVVGCDSGPRLWDIVTGQLREER